MSNINIENLSYDMNMDREAMEAIAGAWGGWAKRWAKKTFRSARKAYSRIKSELLPDGRTKMILKDPSTGDFSDRVA